MTNPVIEFQSASLQAFPPKLLRWYDRHKRDLPWRINPTPYRVWISEIMLQQTQAAAAIPYYLRFLERFPCLESLAGASEQEILELWSGLGYYRRARNLLKTAQIVLNQYREIPPRFDILISLPGIGRYTAGAICAIAFNESQPAVDGNIRRVLTRLFGVQDRAPDSYFMDRMQFLIPKGRASRFTQAMMELGALLCTPSQPHCAACPGKLLCAAHKTGMQDSIPAPRIRREPELLDIALLILNKNGHILTISPIGPAMIPGKWGLPCAIVPSETTPETVALHLGSVLLGKRIQAIPFTRFSHSISHYRLRIHAFYGKLSGRIHADDTAHCRWLTRARIEREIISSLFQKALACYEKQKKKGK